MNYFNTLPLRLQLEQLGKCRFMDQSEFADGVNKLKGKKVVIVGCGAQGLNQGGNRRDIGRDIAEYREQNVRVISSQREAGEDVGSLLHLPSHWKRIRGAWPETWPHAFSAASSSLGIHSTGIVVCCGASRTAM